MSKKKMKSFTKRVDNKFLNMNRGLKNTQTIQIKLFLKNKIKFRSLKTCKPEKNYRLQVPYRWNSFFIILIWTLGQEHFMIVFIHREWEWIILTRWSIIQVQWMITFTGMGLWAALIGLRYRQTILMCHLIICLAKEIME